MKEAIYINWIITAYKTKPTKKNQYKQHQSSSLYNKHHCSTSTFHLLWNCSWCHMSPEATQIKFYVRLMENQKSCLYSEEERRRRRRRKVTRQWWWSIYTDDWLLFGGRASSRPQYQNTNWPHCLTFVQNTIPDSLQSNRSYNRYIAAWLYNPEWIRGGQWRTFGQRGGNSLTLTE